MAGDPMSGGARELLAATRLALAPGELHNRFVERVRDGTLPLSALQAFACEEYLTTRADLRSFTVLAGRFPEAPAGTFFRELVAGEVAAMELLLDMGEALGLERADLAAHEPDPRCQAYPAYVAWLALNGSAADAALALTANFEAWGRFCGQTAAALRDRYGLGDHATAFLEGFAGSAHDEPAAGDVQAVAVIEQSLAGGAPQAPARRAARLLQAYELMFWDALSG